MKLERLLELCVSEAVACTGELIGRITKRWSFIQWNSSFKMFCLFPCVLHYHLSYLISDGGGGGDSGGGDGGIGDGGGGDGGGDGGGGGDVDDDGKAGQWSWYGQWNIGALQV